jgi:cobalt-zinc-cadmium efflux system membrane fusion protein
VARRFSSRNRRRGLTIVTLAIAALPGVTPHVRPPPHGRGNWREIGQGFVGHDRRFGMSQMTQSNSKDSRNSVRSRRIVIRPGMALALILFAAALATGGYRFISNSSGGPARAQEPEKRESAPHLITEGSRIVVPAGSPLRSTLTIDAIGEKEIQRTLALPAVVEADPTRTLKVLTPLAGRVVDVRVRLGQHVAQGQELAVIDSSDLAQAYSDDEKAHAALKLANQTLDRLLALEKTSAIAVKEREQSQNDYAQAQSELARAETRLRAIGVAVHEVSRLLSLKAPVTGNVIDLQIAPGAFLNDATAAIMTIANLDTIWVTANVPEKDTALVAKGQSVDVVFTAYPSEVFKGQVLFVSDVLEPDRIAFENPATRFKLNMFANAIFLSPKENVLVVPMTALMLKSETDQVFVEVAPWTFEARSVEVGFQQDDQAIVTGGLMAGERVVVKGGVLLND